MQLIAIRAVGNSAGLRGNEGIRRGSGAAVIACMYAACRNDWRRVPERVACVNRRRRRARSRRAVSTNSAIFDAPVCDISL